MTPFARSARVYDALTSRKDYRRATRLLVQAVRRVAPDARSVLDIGCGTGRHLQYLHDRFEVEGLDLSWHMLAIARKRCPGVRFHRGTFVDFSLPRRFDLVTCLFGSIGYARTLAGLRKAVRCMAHHLHPNGVLVVEPWVTPERFITGRVVFDYADTGDLKAARMYVTKRRGTVSIFDSHYVVGTRAGVEYFTERQELGLFTDAQYRAAFRDTGLTVVATGPELFGYGLYVCRMRGDVIRKDTARRQSS